LLTNILIQKIIEVLLTNRWQETFERNAYGPRGSYRQMSDSACS